MRDVIGQKVRHKRFGRGTVTDLSRDRIVVAFEEERKKFVYPDAFYRYLLFENHSMQSEIDVVNRAHLREEEKRREKQREKEQHHVRLLAMKIGKKSQAIFNCTREEAEEIFRSGAAETGIYLNGKLKGKPRIPSTLQPNSVLIFTEKDAKSGERRVHGVAMADAYFWGGDCEDGRIPLHESHALLLPESTAPLLRDFEEFSEFCGRWGRIPFKTCSPDAVRELLLELCERLAGSRKEAEIKELCRYFLRINRYPEPVAEKEETV